MAVEDGLALSVYTQGHEALSEGRTAEAVELLHAPVTLSPHFKTLEILDEALVGLGTAVATRHETVS